VAALYVVDIGSLCRGITPDEPCGVNLEYDPAFLELELVVKGKPEVQYGDTIAAATPPDWKLAKAMALALFGRTIDLRVAVMLARALLCVDGLAGFATGLQIVERMLEQYWGGLHPQLDPQDDNDPILRVNTLAALCETGCVLRDLHDAPLVESRAHGRFSLRDVDLATGELDLPENVEKPALASIEAAFLDVDLNELENMDQALSDAYRSSIRIEQVLTENVGASHALDMSALSRLLKRASDYVQERRGRRAGAADSEGAGAKFSPAADRSNQAAPTLRRGGVLSRDDLLAMIDEICGYYEQYEPSSPVPLLLQRARRLVNKSFLEILEDLAPDGLNQLHQTNLVKRE
jgi:type VI secretion system protein ImpA